jgi:hypothetical protein
MRNLIIAAIALSVSACASPQEYPIAPNMVRLDLNAPAAPFVREDALRRAAELTLLNGYSAFRLEPIYMLAFDHFGVIVTMFRAGDPRARDAFDAAELLKKYPWQEQALTYPGMSETPCKPDEHFQRAEARQNASASASARGERRRHRSRS